MSAILELLVPAPTIPKQTMALSATSESVSYANLKRMSITPIFGFEIFNIASASGTILFFYGLQKCKMWFKVLMAI